jgi:Leucine-rich repeat (LRR) protein
MSLAYRILYGNELSGTIPGTLGNLLNLKELVLGKNKLFGSIPSELSALENLEEVSFQDQQGLELIEGRLPDFASARNLWYVDVSANDITGEIPMTFLSGSNALNMSVMILLRDNELTGSVPESLLKFEDVFLDLAGNMISDIPAVFCQKSDWMYGQVGEIGNCDAILCPRGYYSDSGRQDDTESPCQACPGSNGEELYLGQTMCQLSKSEREILMEFFHDTGGSQWITTGSWGSSSPICSWTGVRCVGDQQDDTGVQVINLASNGLTGTIPASLWSLPQLQEVTLSGNDDLIVLFSGVSRGNSAIEVLDLANTRVESLRGIEEAGRLRELNVEEVGLGGTCNTSVPAYLPSAYFSIIMLSHQYVALIAHGLYDCPTQVNFHCSY